MTAINLLLISLLAGPLTVSSVKDDCSSDSLYDRLSQQLQQDLAPNWQFPTHSYELTSICQKQVVYDTLTILEECYNDQAAIGFLSSILYPGEKLTKEYVCSNHINEFLENSHYLNDILPYLHRCVERLPMQFNHLMVDFSIPFTCCLWKEVTNCAIGVAATTWGWRAEKPLANSLIYPFENTTAYRVYCEPVDCSGMISPIPSPESWTTPKHTTPPPYTTKEPTTPYPTEGPTTPYPTKEPTTPYPTEGPTTPYPTKEPTTQYPTTKPTTKEPTTLYPTTEPTTQYPTTEPTSEPTTTTHDDIKKEIDISIEIDTRIHFHEVERDN